MIGAIAGDIAGSIYEFDNVDDEDFCLFDSDCFFTDDTVLTCAVADFLLNGGDLVSIYRRYYARFPSLSWGGGFRRWAESNSMGPYGSYGNGSAMRVSPVGFAFDEPEAVREQAQITADVSHNHYHGVRGAQATALAILLARKGVSKEEIRADLEYGFEYDLTTPLEDERDTYRFDETCQGTVPYAIRAFLESENYEDALRRAIWLGGDSDTIACIAGGIAQAFYGGVPEHVRDFVFEILDDSLAEIVNEFEAQYQH